MTRHSTHYIRAGACTSDILQSRRLRVLHVSLDFVFSIFLLLRPQSLPLHSLLLLSFYRIHTIAKDDDRCQDPKRAFLHRSTISGLLCLSNLNF